MPLLHGCWKIGEVWHLSFLWLYHGIHNQKLETISFHLPQYSQVYRYHRPCGLDVLRAVFGDRRYQFSSQAPYSGDFSDSTRQFHSGIIGATSRRAKNYDIWNGSMSREKGVTPPYGRMTNPHGKFKHFLEIQISISHLTPVWYFLMFFSP